MKLNSAKHFRFWIFLMLLAYLGQAVGLNAQVKLHGGGKHGKSDDFNTQTISNQHRKVISCHDKEPTVRHVESSTESGTENNIKKNSEISKNPSCCDDDCSMASCHNTSAIVTIFNLVTPDSRRSVIRFVQVLSTTQAIQSLYRPPISA